MRRRWRPFWRRLIISLLLLSILCIPGAFALRPHLLRWRNLRALASLDPKERQQAYQFIYNHLDDDPRLLPALNRWFGALPDDTFLHLVIVLDRKTAWKKGTIADSQWLRWIGLEVQDLCSQDTDRRALAVDYLVRIGPTDPRFGERIIAALESADDPSFASLSDALSAAGQWQRPGIPLDSWLRWIKTRTHAPNPEARLLGVAELADLSDVPANPGVLAILTELSADSDADVRYAALGAVAELGGACPAWTTRCAHLNLIAKATADGHPAIARRAWILLALFHPDSGIQATWRGKPPMVAAAMIWAALATNPDVPAPAIEALDDPTVDPSVRAMAVYALHQSPNDAAIYALLNASDGPSAAAPTTAPLRDSIVSWRAILSLPDFVFDQPGGVGGRFTLRMDVLTRPGDDLLPTTAPAAPPVIANPLLLASIFRAFSYQREFERQLADAPPDTLRYLAALEGLPVGRYHIALPRWTPAVHRLAALSVTADPDPEELAFLMRSRDATVRDSACIIAAERLSRPQCDSLAAKLLKDIDQQARKSGAILAGLTGVQLDLLQRVMDRDISVYAVDPSRWETIRIMQLGLWMQDRLSAAQAKLLSDLAPTLANYIPRTTVILAMLYKHHPAALDLLLNPRGEPPQDLIELLDQRRWARVLYHFLPPDAPPLWVWADPELEQFQIDVLRDWYLIHRHQSRDGWLGLSPRAPAQ